jgi:mercuric ion binding protein
MKTLTIIVLSGLSFFSHAQKSDGKLEIKTSAICEMCKETIEYDLTFTKGIKFAELNLENKVVTVEFNPKKISADDVRKRITMVGYHADWLERDSTAYENLPFCCKDGSHGTPVPQVPPMSKPNNQ